MKRTRKIVSGIAVVCFFLCAFVALISAGLSAQAAGNWIIVRSAQTAPTGYTTNAGGGMTSTNEEYQVFYVDSSTAATGDYEISCEMTGTQTFPSSKEVQMGLVPWYVDYDNYIVVYAQWSPTDRNTQMHQIQITGKIGGNFLYGTEEWHTIWTDGITVSPADGLKMTVTKKRSADQTAYIIAVTVSKKDGTVLKSGSVSLPALTNMETTSANVGVYGNRDTVSFNDFSFKVKDQGQTDVDVDAGWQIVRSDQTAPTGYTTNAGGGMTSTNGEYQVFYVDGGNPALGEYEISCEMTGTQTFPSSKEVQMGLVPWYVDYDNYIVVYAQWSPTDRNTQMHQIQITGKIGGNFLYGTEEWHTIWTDGIAVSPADGLKMTVAKKRNTGRTAYNIAVTVSKKDGTILKSGSVSLPALTDMETTSSYVGIYGNQDTVSFNNFTLTMQNKGQYEVTSDGSILQSEGENWNVGGGVCSVNALAATDVNYTKMVVGGSSTGTSASLTSSLHVNSSVEGARVGLVVWYQNEKNYLLAVVGDNTVGFAGRRSNATILQERACDPTLSSLTQIRVEKRAGVFQIYLNNGDLAAEYSNSAMAAAGRYGYCASGADVSFGSIVTGELGYSSYDWTTPSGAGYSFSAKTSDGVSYADGVYTVHDRGVGNVRRTSVSIPTAYSSSLSVSMTFDVREGSVYGVYGWYDGDNNYMLAEISKTGVSLVNIIDGVNFTQRYALPSGFAYVGAHTVQVSYDSAENVTIRLDGITVSDKDAVTWRKASEKVTVGFSALNTGTTVSGVTVSLNSSGSGGVTAGKWVFSDDRVWMRTDVDTIVGIKDYGTAWTATNALYPNENSLANFYMSAEILVTDSYVSESGTSQYQVGLMPYSYNGDYVFVWFSQWSDGNNSQIIIRYRFNGVENEQALDVAYTYFNKANVLEVGVSGDEISVYLNKSFYPITTCYLAGFSSRTLANSHVGLNINYVTAQFSDVSVLNTQRYAVNKETPVFAETGSRPTVGAINVSLALPIVSASNSSGDTLTVEITVLDPDGNAVTLNGNKFLPSKTGEYTVSYVCTDLWGNRAEDSYTVLISKDGNLLEDKPMNVASLVITVAMFAGMLAAIVLSVVVAGKLQSKKELTVVVSKPPQREDTVFDEKDDVDDVWPTESAPPPKAKSAPKKTTSGSTAPRATSKKTATTSGSAKPRTTKSKTSTASGSTAPRATKSKTSTTTKKTT